uniref:Eumenine mastoparan-EF n=1 Tax=Eumenes fraterculus TaxID=1035771 RepID=MASTE_EUMFR|nr:RecName: Full=Eumenine mastoparan-EF; Short=EMP-EF [Eumenes fraterculus]
FDVMGIIKKIAGAL